MRCVVLVLDGLGIGEMPDVTDTRIQDAGCNTLKRILSYVPDISIPNLMRLGLGHTAGLNICSSGKPVPSASYGSCLLAYEGADSYLGHQEIMGTIPARPVKTLMSQVAGRLEKVLLADGYVVEKPIPGRDLMLVNGTIVIGDNLEADAGQNINLTVPTALVDFEKALQLGRLVREQLQVARVIVFGGPTINVQDILSHVKEKTNGQVGVDSPALGVYDENLRVQHLGYGIDPQQQVSWRCIEAGYPVVLLGKMADLITCPGAEKNPLVSTPQVMAALIDAFRPVSSGFIAATVQETDLAGHEGDVHRMARVLEEVDQALPELLAVMQADDMLLVCADHGNDPLQGTGLHTRERTPLLLYRPCSQGVHVGERCSLADIGATAAAFFAVKPTADGISVFENVHQECI